MVLEDLLLTTLWPTARLLQLLPAMLGVLGVALVGGVLLVRYRKSIFADGSDDSAGSAPMTLQDLRDMRNRGELTEDEFLRMKAVMVAELKGIRLSGDQLQSGGHADPGVDELRAPPGYDLTGEPLPDEEQADSADGLPNDGP